MDIDNIEAIVVKKPDFIFSSLLSWWTERITSGGPCHLLSLLRFLINPTNTPINIGIAKK